MQCYDKLHIKEIVDEKQVIRLLNYFIASFKKLVQPTRNRDFISGSS